MTVFDWIKSKLSKRPSFPPTPQPQTPAAAIDRAALMALVDYEHNGCVAITLRWDGHETVLMHSNIPPASVRALLDAGQVLTGFAPDVRTS
jgi:hypothetical protein